MKEGLAGNMTRSCLLAWWSAEAADTGRKAVWNGWSKWCCWIRHGISWKTFFFFGHITCVVKDLACRPSGWSW